MNGPVSLFLLLLCAFLSGTGQGRDEARRRFPEIRILISKGQYNILTQSKGQKVTLKQAVMLVNGDTTKVKEIHSRGNNSLKFEHKSLSVDLIDGEDLNGDGKKVKIKKFDLLNLAMDKNLWHNRWAFLGMSELGIFPLYNIYCTVWVNDQPQGIYLLVEKPHHFTEKVKSPYTVRRGPDHSIDAEYVDTPVKEDGKKYRKQYLGLYENIRKYKEEELYKKLDASLMLDQYFLWLAFNYLIMNGDYADEVFFYIDSSTRRFDVLPWDYDDILRPAPHEGFQARNAVPNFKEKLVFSSEDMLDRIIATDNYIYQQYQGTFRKLLTTLPTEALTRLCVQVSDELRELSADPVIAKASLFLGKDPFIMDQAAEEIRLGLDFVIKRRNALLTKLE